MRRRWRQINFDGIADIVTAGTGRLNFFNGADHTLLGSSLLPFPGSLNVLNVAATATPPVFVALR